MEFIVKEMASKPGTIYVRYDCTCGCKPGVEHERGSQEVAHEGCCCGNVHFVGRGARQELDRYIAGRIAEDMELGGYNIAEEQLATPWGYSVTVAYATPAKPRAH